MPAKSWKGVEGQCMDCQCPGGGPTQCPCSGTHTQRCPWLLPRPGQLPQEAGSQGLAACGLHSCAGRPAISPHRADDRVGTRVRLRRPARMLAGDRRDDTLLHRAARPGHSARARDVAGVLVADPCRDRCAALRPRPPARARPTAGHVDTRRPPLAPVHSPSLPACLWLHGSCSRVAGDVVYHPHGARCVGWAVRHAAAQTGHG